MINNAPMDTRVTSQVPEQATMVLSQPQYYHAEAHHIHDTHNKMDAKLKTMLLKAADITYIFSLHNFFLGYMVLWTKYIKDIMNHLMKRYGTITATDIE